MNRPNRLLNFKNPHQKQRAFALLRQKTPLQLQNASQIISAQILNTTRPMDKETIFFSEPKDSQVYFSCQKLKVRSQGSKGVDLRFQYKNQGLHIDDESNQVSQQNMNFFSKQPEFQMYKGGPASSQKKYIKSLMEIDQSRLHMQSGKEEQIILKRIKEEDSPPVQFDRAGKQPTTDIFFFKEPYELPCSKLLWFKPNVKNGRNIIYNAQQMKCQAIFKCEGCLKVFDVPSALGGHLSRCQNKVQHFRNIARINFQTQMRNRTLARKKYRKNYQDDQQNNYMYQDKKQKITLLKSLLGKQQSPNATQAINRRSQRVLKCSQKNQQKEEEEIVTSKPIKRIIKRKKVGSKRKAKNIKKQIQ